MVLKMQEFAAQPTAPAYSLSCAVLRQFPATPRKFSSREQQEGETTDFAGQAGKLRRFCNLADMTYVCTHSEARLRNRNRRLRRGKVLLEAERALDAPHVFFDWEIAHSAQPLPNFPEMVAVPVPPRSIHKLGGRSVNARCEGVWPWIPWRW